MSQAVATAELPHEIEALKALYLAETERLRRQIAHLEEQLQNNLKKIINISLMLIL